MAELSATCTVVPILILCAKNLVTAAATRTAGRCLHSTSSLLWKVVFIVKCVSPPEAPRALFIRECHETNMNLQISVFFSGQFSVINYCDVSTASVSIKCCRSTSHRVHLNSVFRGFVCL
ncbi:hypothetical protein GOP47_0025985 [Adiantum capillus-veneris]|uniref:Secreted protein n=1 Tax=Adiantum capillus-veneris TaxID=13818 RepID=A0A9D4Z4N2_ADICA|nr:hypothetical protein GOP47_0025985 [Adiantum capillus-veneris]